MPSDVASVKAIALRVTMNRPITYYTCFQYIMCYLCYPVPVAIQAPKLLFKRVVIDCPLFSGFLHANQLFLRGPRGS